MEKVLNKSDLITRLSSECENIPEKTIEDATKQIIDLMVDTLSQNGRVEYAVLVVLVCIIVSHVWRATLKQARKLP